MIRFTVRLNPFMQPLHNHRPLLLVLVNRLLRDRAREAVAMTSIETERDEAQASAEQAEQELEMAQIDVRAEKLRADSLSRIVRDVCKGEEPSDLMWTRIHPAN